MNTVLRYYLSAPQFGPVTVGGGKPPLFGPVTKAGETQPEPVQPKRGRQSDLEWARSHYPWLKEFADNEIKVNHGHKHPIAVVAEHPEVNVDPRAKAGVHLVHDRRIPSEKNYSVQLVELTMHGVTHPGAIVGARDWMPESKISARSYGENQSGRDSFDGTVIVQVEVDGALSDYLNQMMRALVFARACALGIIKPEDTEK